jgi:hypothetical protein
MHYQFETNVHYQLETKTSTNVQKIKICSSVGVRVGLRHPIQAKIPTHLKSVTKAQHPKERVHRLAVSRAAI